MVIFNSSPVVDFYFTWNRINESPESWWIYSLNLLFFEHGVNVTNINVVSALQKFSTEANDAYLGIGEGCEFRKNKKEGRRASGHVGGGLGGQTHPGRTERALRSGQGAESQPETDRTLKALLSLR